MILGMQAHPITITVANRIGPYPQSPWGIIVDGMLYSVDGTTGLTWDPATNSLHWNPLVRGFDVPVGAEVGVLMNAPVAPQAEPQASAQAAVLAEYLARPKSVTIDGNTIVEHGMDQIIKADQYDRATQALANCRWPLQKPKKAMPPRAV